MNIVLLGLNHKTAPIELRERLAIGPQQLEEATRSLLQAPGVIEGMILSTCNRVELLTSQEPDAPHLLDFLGNYFGIERQLLAPHLYEYRQQDAVRHLFRVACSLDSMVIGEPQILGQVKSSYLTARSAGAIRGHLDKVLQRAFVVAKRVRSETQIGSASVSIASVAVELARKIFGSLQDKTVLLVGAGKMSEQAARHLVDQGAGTVLVANRSHERGELLAQRFGGEPSALTTSIPAPIRLTSSLPLPARTVPFFAVSMPRASCSSAGGGPCSLLTSRCPVTWTLKSTSWTVSSSTTSTTCNRSPARTSESGSKKRSWRRP